MSLYKNLPRKNFGGKMQARRPLRIRDFYHPAVSRHSFLHLIPGVQRLNSVFDDVDPLDLQNPKDWNKTLKKKDRRCAIAELGNIFYETDDALNMEAFMCEAANSVQEYEMLQTLFQKAYGQGEDNRKYDTHRSSNCSSDAEYSEDSDYGDNGNAFSEENEKHEKSEEERAFIEEKEFGEKNELNKNSSGSSEHECNN
ncbi:hypothetical protein V9T40_009019 [Parthenolecanium corni]|uniref:Uncharacterized protein n=1 Tax=Parthenolecanium corni TaxID=536013 RepID=A0AAN9Y6E5_9HEMI